MRHVDSTGKKRGKLAPFGFHNLFSLGIGLVTGRFIHTHEVMVLAAAQVIWVLSMVFIGLRAKRSDWKFLEGDVLWYHALSIPFYVAGLLFAVCYYAVYG